MTETATTVKGIKKIIDEAKKALLVNLNAAYQAFNEDDTEDIYRQTDKAVQRCTAYLMAVSNLYRHARGVVVISERVIRDLLLTTATGEAQGLIARQATFARDPATGETIVQDEEEVDRAQRDIYTQLINTARDAHDVTTEPEQPEAGTR